MYGYIYKTTNLINNKIYIGQKKSDKFLENKYLGSGKLLRQAVEKDGYENFKVELLEECSTQKELADREIFWIAYYKSTDSSIGYNLSDGGYVPRFSGERNGFYGKHHSEETRKHLKEKWALNKKNRAGINHPGYGKHRSEETKQKISLANSGRIKTEEEKEKRLESLERNGTKNFYKSAEFRMKLSKAKKGKPSKSKGRIHITNDIDDKMIYEEELQFYLSNGWRKGRKKFSEQACLNISRGHKGHRAHNKDKVWIHNSITNKTIYEHELDYYLNNGWYLGMRKREKLK